MKLKLKERIGAWLCRREWHNVKRYVSVDWANSRGMATEVEVCQRCKQITIVGITSDTEQIRKMVQEIAKRGEKLG
jgi:hypothetical protein